MIIYILLTIILLLFLIILIPHSIQINIDYEYKDNLEKVKEDNYIKVKLFNIITVSKIKIFKKVIDVFEKNKVEELAIKIKEQIDYGKRKLDIKRGIKFDKIFFSLGFNLEDYIINSYVNAALNTILCMYININQEMFDIKKLYYNIYISDKPINIYISSNINICFLKMLFRKK